MNTLVFYKNNQLKVMINDSMRSNMFIIDLLAFLLTCLLTCSGSSQEAYKGCQTEDNGVYMDGEAWSNGCRINYCKEGSVSYSQDVTCCFSGNNTHKNGEFWYKGLTLFVCAYGIEKIALDYKGIPHLQVPIVPEMSSNDLKLHVRKKRAANIHLCSPQGAGIDEKDIRFWNQKCYHKKCRGNIAIWDVDKDCCEFDDVTYPDGASWSHKCTIYFCNAGAMREQIDKNCCSYNDQKYPNGHKWDTEDNDCHHRQCISGVIVKTKRKSCCEDDGVMYTDGEYWYLSNPKWVCRDGKIQCLADSDEYCTFDRRVYASGDIWTWDCYTYNCNRSLIYSYEDHHCMIKQGKKCDHIIVPVESADPNAVCASHGGICKNKLQQSGLCRASCLPGEISIGHCDGKSCICCGKGDTEQSAQESDKNVMKDADIKPLDKSIQDCILDGGILGNGRSKVEQSKCVTYMCSNGNLIQANIDNCHT